MANNDNTNASFDQQYQQVVNEANKQELNLDNIPQIPIGNYNFSNSTRWVFMIPFGLLFNKYDDRGKLIDVPLNCKAVDFPNFQMANTSVHHQGYAVPVSMRVNDTEKTLVVRYNPSSNWIQYLMLLKWYELEDYTNYDTDKDKVSSVELGDIMIPAYNDPQSSPFNTTQGPAVPTNLHMFDNFYNKLFSIRFTGCWLTQLNRVTLDYEKTDKTEILSEFTMRFYKYDIDVTDKALNLVLN